MRKSVAAHVSSILTIIGMLAAMVATSPRQALAVVQRVKFLSGDNYLIVEFLDDDLVHFELSAVGPGPGTGSPIFTTPQVAKTDYAGPSSFTQFGSTLETPEIRVAVDTTTLCVTATDKIKHLLLTALCPLNLTQAWKGLTLTPERMQHVYGLGEQFITVGSADGDWTGRIKSPGDTFGNQMVGFNGGANGNAQIPVMYAVGPNNANYALFLDQVYKTTWDFTANPWKVETWGDQIRWYLMTGPDLPDLRKDYMELTGRPLVPPKKMFGLWVSEYGYDNWAEIEGKLSTLRTNKFPIDGFVLDLQWFGGVSANSDDSNMGRVT
jgi:alpha-glucosidase (family GH31 glycosyl hydrolase)